MSINIKSNKRFIINIFGPIAAVLGLCVIMMGVTLIVEYDNDLIPIFIFFCAFAVVYITVMLTVYLWKGKRYEFTDTQIICYKRNKLLDKINIDDVHFIKFYKFKARYLIPVFIAEVESGGCWSLHVHQKDGTKKILRFFSAKDALLLKERLFGELLTII